MSMPLSLLHLPNRPDPLSEAQLRSYRVGGFQGAKLLKEHTAEHIAQLERVRPGGRYFSRLDDTTREDGSFPSFDEIGDKWVAQILHLEPMGVYDWQVDVEPNNRIPVSEAFTWQWLVAMSVRYVRATLMQRWEEEGYGDLAVDYRLGRLRFWIAPLADGPGHWADIEGEKGWWAAYEELVAQPHLFYGMCVDSYWQYPKHALQDGFGANVVRHHKRFVSVRPDMRYFIAEWGCSRIDVYPEYIRRNPPPDVLSLIEGVMLETYKPWLEWHAANAPYVDATCLFISPGSYGWVGFEPSTAVLTSIA